MKCIPKKFFQRRERNMAVSCNFFPRKRSAKMFLYISESNCQYIEISNIAISLDKVFFMNVSINADLTAPDLYMNSITEKSSCLDYLSTFFACVFCLTNSGRYAIYNVVP